MLLIDLDPQGNGTMGTGVDKRNLQKTVYELLLGTLSFDDVVQHSEVGGFDVLPANRELAGADRISWNGIPRRSPEESSRAHFRSLQLCVG